METCRLNQFLNVVKPWLHKNFEFFGMEGLPSFSCHDVLKNADVEKDLQRYEEHLSNIFP